MESVITDGVESTYLLRSKPALNEDETDSDYYDPVQVGTSQRPEDTPGWSLRRTHRDIALNFLTGNGIFLAWVPDDISKLLTRMAEEMKKEPYPRDGKFHSQKFETNVAITTMEHYFKEYVREYRRRGIEAIIEMDRVRESIQASGAYIERFLKPESLQFIKDEIEYLLKNGKDDNYTNSNCSRDIVFVIKGIVVPVGTRLWALIDPSSEKYKVTMKGPYKSTLASHFVAVAFDTIMGNLLLNFNYYTKTNARSNPGIARDLAQFNKLPVSDRINNIEFRRWLWEESGTGLRELTPESLYEYVMTHDKLHIRGFAELFYLFRLLTF